MLLRSELSRHARLACVAIAALAALGLQNDFRAGYDEEIQFTKTHYELQPPGFWRALVRQHRWYSHAYARGGSRRREIGLAILQGVELRRSQAR